MEEYYVKKWVKCDRCNGKGVAPSDKFYCQVCQATGFKEVFVKEKGDNSQ